MRMGEDNLSNYATELGLDADSVTPNCACEGFVIPHQGRIEPMAAQSELFGVGIPASSVHIPFRLTGELRPFAHDYNLTPDELSMAGLLTWMKLSRLQDTRGGIEFFSFSRYAIHIGRSALLPEGILREEMTQILQESGCGQLEFRADHQPAGFR